MYFAISSLSFVFRLLLMAEVRDLPLPSRGVRMCLSINQSFSRSTTWYREVYKPPLSKEFALQSRFETVRLSPGREGYGYLHPGKPLG
jgi:hypothetical protein